MKGNRELLSSSKKSRTRNRRDKYSCEFNLDLYDTHKYMYISLFTIEMLLRFR